MILLFSRLLLAAFGLLLAVAPVLRGLDKRNADSLSGVVSESLRLIQAGAWLDTALAAFLLVTAALPRRNLLGAGERLRALIGRTNLGDRLLLETGTADAGDGGRALLRDSLCIAVLAAAAGLAYLPAIGLYSDDYAFLAAFTFSADQSLPGLLGTLYSEIKQHARPVHFLYISALYDAFGFRLFWYQAVNLAVIAACGIAFHLVLRTLGQPRALALAIPLIFLSLPHFSTDRIWISAFQVPLSVLLYFLSLYADLRGLRATRRRSWAWKLAAVTALVASFLAYEITLFLLLLNPLIVWIRSRQLHGPADAGRRLKTTAGFAINFLLVGALLVFKFGVSARIGMNGEPFDYVARQFYMLVSPYHAMDYHGGLNIWRALYVDFIRQGVELPYLAFQAGRDYARTWEFALALAIGVIVFAYLRSAAGADESWPAGRRAWLRVFLAGLVVYALGYGAFVLTPQIVLTQTGVGNRVSMAAAAGVAICAFAILGCLASRARSRRARAALLSGLTAFVVAGSVLVNGAVASFWVMASERQARVLEAITREFPTLPEGTTLLLHGICPYVGPGIVFETNWDFGNALRLVYRDPTLRGDVAAGNAEIRDSGIAVQLYGAWHEHPYSENLIIFDPARETRSRLTDMQAARRFLAGSAGALGADCPAGREGRGMPIF